MNSPPDELWTHFEPLWMELQRLSPGTLLTGGDALFLKQQWLVSQQVEGDSRVASLVGIDRWANPFPRVTKDLDFVVELKLIASANEQAQIDAWLNQNGFVVVERNRRWQFAKALDAERDVKVDFHAGPPRETRTDLRIESRRVKPHPSLGQSGIHGRENPEAVGCELHPFRFVINGVEVVIPNPVSSAMMKLITMRDRRIASQLDSNAPEKRELDFDKAQDQARDVGRIVAMLTRHESDTIAEIVSPLQSSPVFEEAAEVCRSYFGENSAWGAQVVADQWRPEDWMTIRATLASWFDRPAM